MALAEEVADGGWGRADETLTSGEGGLAKERRALGGHSARMGVHYGWLHGMSALDFLRQVALFVLTALAEIVGCYLPWLVLKQGRSPWLLVPALVSLSVFAWLLTLHPTAAGRTYAAYGGIYIAVALAWLRIVDGMKLSGWDVLGACVALLGMAIIVVQPQS